MTSVVVIAHRSEEHLEACLQALLADGVSAGQILVWDNNSPDRSAGIAAEILGETAVVRAGENIGFAVAVNRAAALRPGDDLLLVNPDAVIQPGSVAALQDALTDPRVAVVGSRLVGADGTPRTDAWRFPTPRLAILGSVVGLGRAYRPARQVLDGLEYLGDAFVPFTVALLRRSVFDTLDGLDEAFWLYGEDSEYCYRAFRQGHDIAIAAGAVARHEGGASSVEEMRMPAQLAGGDRFREKHFGARRARVAGRALHLGGRGRLALGRGRFPEWRHVLRHYASSEPGSPSRTGMPVVLHVILTTQRAGTERHVVELCAALRERGWDTHIAALASADEDVLRDYASVATLHPLPARPALLLGPQVARLARSIGAAVVHGHYGNATFVALIAARAAGARAVTTLHLLELAHAARRSARLQKILYRAMMRQLDEVIAVSAAVATRAIQDGLSTAERIVVVHNGIADPSGLTPPTERLGHALFVGRLAAEKRVDLAIRSVAGSGSSRLRIVGQGEQEHELRRLAEQVMPGRCDFVGYLQDPAEEMRTASVLLMPSPAEPFGLVAIEAMALETPVVGFAAGGVAEIVVDGVTGLLATPGDEAHFEQLAARLLDGPEEAAEMGRAGRASYLRQFSASVMADRTEQVYRGIVSEASPDH